MDNHGHCLVVNPKSVLSSSFVCRWVSIDKPLQRPLLWQGMRQNAILATLFKIIRSLQHMSDKKITRGQRSNYSYM